jgi:Neuraminidase (sialidase)
MLRRSFLATPVLALRGAPAIEKIDLFESGKDGYALYRIPGIILTPEGSLLAYCEARKSERGDWGTIDIMLRRSTDKGKSFSPRRTISSVEGPVRKNPVALAQNLATAGEVTFNNPVAIPDAHTKSVHFVFCLEYMRAFYMRSGDDGVTFTKPVEITAAFDKFRPEYPWKVLATGPGHGIQLRSGRLVIPIWLSTGTGGHAHRPSVTSTIYSDDHGKTWHRGEIAVPDTPEWVFPNETTAVELPSGEVLLNVRSESKAHRRLHTRSKDGATKWSKPEFHPQLLEPICMGSIARSGKYILFSNPDNLDRVDGNPQPGKNRDRRNLTVQLSEDGAKTFSIKKVIEPSWSGYSDLAATPAGEVYLFYERGAQGQDHFRTAALTLARFPLEWLKTR